MSRNYYRPKLTDSECRYINRKLYAPDDTVWSEVYIGDILPVRFLFTDLASSFQRSLDEL